MAYDKRLETSRKAMESHNEAQMAAASARLKRVAEQVKAKKRRKQEAQA